MLVVLEMLKEWTLLVTKITSLLHKFWQNEMSSEMLLAYRKTNTITFLMQHPRTFVIAITLFLQQPITPFEWQM